MDAMLAPVPLKGRDKLLFQLPGVQPADELSQMRAPLRSCPFPR